jgi:hypothetical protein
LFFWQIVHITDQQRLQVLLVGFVHVSVPRLLLRRLY